MNRNHFATIFFCSVLIFSVYSIPNQIGDAYAHRSDSHEKCWWGAWNLPGLITSLATLAAQVILIGLAPFTAGASLAYLSPVENIGFAASIISIAVLFIATDACGPQIIPPAEAVAAESHLDCTSDSGFAFTKIESTLESQSFVFTDNFVANTTHKIIGDEGFERTIPETTSVNAFHPNLMWALIILIGFFILDVILFLIPTPPKVDAPVQDLFKKNFPIREPAIKTIVRLGLFSLLTAVPSLINNSLGIIELSGGNALPVGNFEINSNILQNHPNIAKAYHPFATQKSSLDNTVTKKGSGNEFKLGTNEIKYITNKVKGIPGSDSDDFPINVYDNEPPKIDFTSKKHVILEANTHYGFEVNTKSLPLLQKGIEVSDNCSSGEDVKLEYIGNSFYLVSSLKENQYAQWMVNDKPPKEYHKLTSTEVRGLLEDLGSKAVFEDNSERTAQINPFEHVNFTLPKEGESSLRHLFVEAANFEINDLIEIQKERSKLPPTADVTIGGDLIDFTTNDKISIVGVEQETRIITGQQVDKRVIPTDSLPEQARKAITDIGGEFEMAEPNFFVDFQFVMVNDTIAPNILVTEDLAVSVNSTHPFETNSTIVDKEMGGCAGMGKNITCALKIRPPAVFDIADPFPIIYENFTKKGVFTPIENDLLGNFTLDVHTIGWKAVDFTGNGNKTSDVVTQFVNLKLNGTNKISIVFDTNATVFSTVPQQITLIANNTDQDPLKFFIEGNPSKGILDTPIDAVFLTKFQQFGAVSKLKGITNEGEGSTEIFLTDSGHERVLKINAADETLMQSFVGPQLGTPIAISKSGFNWDEFTISDWSENKIIQTTGIGTVLKTFDVQGLFEKPEYLSVEQTSDDIFVTDSVNRTISILDDFRIFDSPTGVEVDKNSDTVYVVEKQDGEIKAFDTSGIFVGSFGSGQLDSPSDVTVDSQGNIYVLDSGTNLINNYTSNFTSSNNFGSKANSQSFFNGPEGITINGKDIFVADTQNHQVKKVSSFEPSILEFYGDASLWLSSSTAGVSVTGGVAKFNATSGVGQPISHVFMDLMPLGDSWSAEFEIERGEFNDDANAFIWLLTNNTDHPQNVSAQDALGVVYDDQELKIFQRHGDVSSVSSGITLPTIGPEDFFVSLEKIGLSQASMAIYTDEAKTTQLADGNVTHVISDEISGLRVLQHANDIVDGSNKVELEIDDTYINPLVTWLGKCESGPNCNSGISDQFTCTDTTCFGSGIGSLDGQFDSPEGVSANSTNLFVADHNNNRVQIFNAAGDHVTNLSVTLPTDVEYSNAFNRTVVSSGDQKVIIFINDTDSIEFGEPGSEPGDFSFLSSLGIDNLGNIYVTDIELTNLQKFDGDGNFIEEWSSSINARFGDFIERFQLYLTNIQAGALDVHDVLDPNRKVVIGDWTPTNERIIVANALGGKITKHDVSQITQKPHSLAFNQANEIFITDPSVKNLVVVDRISGDNLRNISTSSISENDITPTGITINNIQQFPGEKIYVFDNNTDKIFSITEGPNTANQVFDAKELFVNLNDIAVNDTHVFGLDLNQNKSSIVQIRWDKGIQDEVPINNNISGISVGVNGESDLLFFTTAGSTNELLSYDRTTDTTTNLIDLTSLGVTPSGITTIPMLSTLVNVTIDDIEDPRGITFGHDNKKLFVSEFRSDKIKVFNATTFELIETITDEAISLPIDLVFGPNGTLFVASFGNDDVLEINLDDNNSVTTFAHGGNGISYPVGLAVSPDSSKLYVSSSIDNEITIHALVNITETMTTDYTNQVGEQKSFTFEMNIQQKGDTLGTLVNASNSETLAKVQDITIGPDDRLYAASFNSDQILTWNLDGTFTGVFGEANNEDSPLNGPAALLFSTDGSSLFVSSSKNNQVLQYNGTTGDFIGIFSDETAKVPDGLALKPDGNLLVSSRNSGSILEYGKLESKFYVSDWSDANNHRILGLSDDGIITLNTTLDHLNLVNPQNIVADNLAKLWIADTGPPSRLVQINPVSNITLTTIDVSNLVEVSATNVTLVPNSEPPIYVDDLGNNFTSIPQDVVTTITPKGLSVDKNDKLYVTDWNNHRIIQLDQNGTFSGQIRVNSTFTEPMDIAVNQTDRGKLSDIWVFDANFEDNGPRFVSLDVEKQFKKIEFEDELSPLLRGLASSQGNMITTPSNSGSLFVIDSGLNAFFDSKHFIIPLGIDLGEDSIYVSDWKEKRIVELDKSADFKNEFDYKLVGFPTSELGDLEVSEDNELFWITEPRRAVIDQIQFDGTITKYISVADKYVVMASVESDLEDNFYVASTEDDSIKKFDIRGTSLGNTIVNLGSGSMQDIALDSSGSDLVYLAISGMNKQIKTFDSTTLKEIFSFDLDFQPTSVTVDIDGFIYVSKADLQVTKFNQDFSSSSTFLVDTVGGQITDMVVDTNNNLYAADKTNHRVYKYNLPTDALVGWLGKCDTTSNQTNCLTESLHSKGFTCLDAGPGSCSTDADGFPDNGKAYGRGIGQFFEPIDLAIDGLDNIYVADVKLSPAQIDQNMPDEDLINLPANVPRVQKFSQEGFFVDQVISDLDNALVQGNFEWIKAIAYGKNNFYVADVDKLHVFDVSPFRNITFDPLTQNTTAQVTYESLIDIVDDTDSFLYSVFDGFDKSMNIGTVDISIVDPDPDGDGIFGDIDLSNVTSTEFKSPRDGTFGNITDGGDQTLIIREARDPEKGLYIQADIRKTGDSASVNLCENLAEIELTPGDRLIATCILGANNNTEGVELEVLRGEVSGKFFDGNGRTSSYIIPVDNIIFMGQEPFEFISGEKNFDTIKQKVLFNDMMHNYFVPPESTVRVDTAPPMLPEEKCTVPLELEAESVLGVTWNGDLTDADSNLLLTGQFEKIKAFLDFNSTEVDNGNPQETDGDDTEVMHNATTLFRYGNSSIPFETQVEFFTVDKIGNNSTCINSVFVRDTTPPILDIDLDFNTDFMNTPDGLRITNESSRFSETGRVFWELPKILDLPDVYRGETLEVFERLEVENSTSDCSYTSGSSFKISPKFTGEEEDEFIDSRVNCFGKDLADNINDDEFGFSVRITPHPDGLRIKNVTAADQPLSRTPSPGLTVGDNIWVEFTMPTNQPPVETKTNLDDIFDLSNGDFGNDAKGKWVNPSNLLISIDDITPPLDLVENTTIFDLKFNPALTSSGGLLNSSGTLGDVNPILLGGDFSKPIPPFISAFIANDPIFDSDDQRNAVDYSKDDTFTIRFSEPVKHPFGRNLDKSKIDSQFSFSHELGEDYSGVWKNRSTLVITVDEVLDDDPSLLPTLGTTTATVTGDITNRAGTSENSKSVSPPLSGTFGDYYLIMDINENGMVTQTLPTGITLGINFPNGTTVSMFEADINIASRSIAISEILDITITNSTADCEMGCDVTFWIHQSELDEFGVSVDALRILHDANDDDVFDFNESLVPEIEEITTNLFSVTVKLFSFSSLALSAVIGGGGGGGDETPPSFESWDYISCDPAIGCGTHIIKEIKFVTDMPTAIIPTGHSAKFILRVNENSGPNALQHVTLYTNIRGFADGIPGSDTFIRFDKGKPITVQDPHGFLSDAQVSVMPRGNNIDVIFTLLFDKPMEKSDIIIRAWDQSRNSRDAIFADAIEVIPGIAEEPSKFGGILGDSEPKGPIMDTEPIFSYNLFRDWAGFSDGQLSDSEFLSHLEIDGKKIPSWFKQSNISKWVMDEMLSQQEFIDALRFLSEEGLLKG